MPEDERPTKKEAFTALMREGPTLLHLDARRPGVEVPDHLRGEAHLILVYGFALPVPIPDLEVREDGVVATLSFARTPHRTFVPWQAVYVVSCDDGRGVLYAEDVPDEVGVEARPLTAGAAVDAPARAATRDRRPAAARAARFKVLSGGAPPPDGLLPPEAAPERPRPQLRLVK